MVKSVGKHIGTSFLILAMLVLFAHAVVPHHHHNRQVCIENFDCTHHDTGTSHPEDNNAPYDDKNQSCCIINQLVVIPNNQWKQECAYPASSDKHFHELVSLISGNNSVVFHSFISPWKPVAETPQYALLLPASLRLRAPPAA